MKFLRFLIMSLVIGGIRPALADADIFANEGVTSFQKDTNSWRRDGVNQPVAQASDAAQGPKLVLKEIRNSVGEVALNNIENSEQIFCYELSARPTDYDGYTLDGMAVTGFCGVIKKEVRNIILEDLFKNDRNILFNVQEECVIRPRVMLRFVRGIDFTDVMFSSPCYSYAIYYGGQVNIFNTKPAAKILDTLIASFAKNRVDFISPALLEQLMPVGVPQTPEQRDLVSTKSKPVRNWEEKKLQPSAETAKPKTEKKKGWNDLDIGF